MVLRRTWAVSRPKSPPRAWDARLLPGSSPIRAPQETWRHTFDRSSCCIDRLSSLTSQLRPWIEDKDCRCHLWSLRHRPSHYEAAGKRGRIWHWPTSLSSVCLDNRESLARTGFHRSTYEWDGSKSYITRWDDWSRTHPLWHWSSSKGHDFRSSLCDSLRSPDPAESQTPEWDFAYSWSWAGQATRRWIDDFRRVSSFEWFLPLGRRFSRRAWSVRSIHFSLPECRFVRQATHSPSAGGGSREPCSPSPSWHGPHSDTRLADRGRHISCTLASLHCTSRAAVSTLASKGRMDPVAEDVATLARAFLQFVQAFGVTESGTFLFLFPCSWFAVRDLPCNDGWSMLIENDDDGWKSPSARSLTFAAMVMLALCKALKRRLNVVS